MRLAILSDIHANRAAFLAVLDDLAERDCGRIVLLGDLVGYGPDPGFCTDLAADLMAKGAIAVRGNHDDAILRPDPGFSRHAKTAIDWTRGVLSADQAGFLAALPMEAELDDLLFVHASAQQPGDWIYIESDRQAAGALRCTRQRVVFCGHVHRPQLYTEDMGGTVRGLTIPMGLPLPLPAPRRWLAVAGSVGQPRDGNPAAGYVIYDQTRAEVTFRRVPYDIADTAARIRAAGLPDALAKRLQRGGGA